jgi:L-threonylcarbamoyladenylate synthase
MVRDTDIETAIAHLRAGALVAIPTETVYGLAGDAMNPLAIRRIYATKGRPAGHPVIVHLGPDADPNEWGEMTPLAQTLAKHFWPGPLTLIVKRRPRVLDEVTGGLDTVGLRVPSHPVAQTLLSAFGGGLAAPSANRFGRISPTTAHHVQADLGSEVMVLDGGPSAVGIESTIIDVSENKPCMLRPGVIDPESIEACVGPLGISNTPAPGTLKSHYAPMTSLLLSHNPESDRKRLEAEGRTVAVLEATKLEDHARNLYGELRRLDALGVDILIAEMATNVGIGLAINDRLSRAATKLPTGQ